MVFFVVTLCSYGSTADFEVFPAKELAFNINELGLQLKLLGYGTVSTDGTRLRCKIDKSDIMINDNGRMIIEQVAPPVQSAAADIVRKLSQLF